MAYWLMKTEPSQFSFDDLMKAKNKTTGWSEVRNYQARNLMRDEMKVGGDQDVGAPAVEENRNIAGVREGSHYTRLRDATVAR